MLTREQIDTFRRDGVLVLRGLFSAGEIAEWRNEVFDYFERPGSPDDWRTALTVHKSDDFRLRREPTPHGHPALRSVYESLHAVAQWTGENELLVRPGHEPVPWLGARAPHLDFPLAAPVRTLANNVIYLSDVRERGGAFMYWPGSHRVAWNYFRRNPDDYLSRGQRSQDQTFAILRREIENEPVEFLGAAGDVLVWHSLTFHSASVNTRIEPRIAIFGRWGVHLGDEPIYDFDASMWSYWDFEALPVEEGICR
jgi:hypothetical protein